MNGLGEAPLRIGRPGSSAFAVGVPRGNDKKIKKRYGAMVAYVVVTGDTVPKVLAITIFIHVSAITLYRHRRRHVHRWTF